MRPIAVTALPDGWQLTVDDIANTMIFRSGREAERAARRLADRLARAGVWSEIELHLKDGTLAEIRQPWRPGTVQLKARDPELRDHGARVNLSRGPTIASSPRVPERS